MAILAITVGADNRNEWSSTNSEQSCRNIRQEPPKCTGVDTIRVTGRISGHSLLRRTVGYRLNLSTGEEVACRESGWLALDVGAPVRLIIDDRHGQRATCEFSVPRCHRSSNRHPSDLNEVANAVQDVYSLAKEHVTWADDWRALRITRVDLAHDFRGVFHPGPILDRLARQPKRRGQSIDRWVDRSGSGCESLAVQQPRRWRVNAYDKAAELRASARRLDSASGQAARLLEAAEAQREGQLRVEVQVRSAALRDWLREPSIDTLLADHERLDTMAHYYFRRAGLDTAVRGPDALRGVLDLLDASDERSAADRMIAVMLRDALGRPQVAHRQTVAKARNLASKYRLTAADFRLEGTGEVQLDWQSSSLRTTEGEVA